MLQSPPTMRLAEAHEVPRKSEILTRIKQGKQANIVEGFTLRKNETNELPFAFYAEINVNNPRFWDVFLTLSAILPELASCLYGFRDEEPTFSDYLLKDKILSQLEKFKLELTQDCSLEFGLIHQTEEVLVELFADHSKYLKLWGTEETSFRQIMASFSIVEIAGLNFYDEYPKVTFPLINLNDKAISTEQVLQSLDTLLG